MPLELAIKDAAKKAAREAGGGISAATVDAQIRQAGFDRFLSRVFAEGETSEWMLKGGLSMATRRFIYACRDADTSGQIDTVTVDVVVGPTPVGTPEYVEPANRLHLHRPLTTHPYRLFPVVDQVADKVCATMSTDYPGGRRSSRIKDLVDLVVLARSQTVGLAELRMAITTKQVISGMQTFDQFDIPETWRLIQNEF